MKNETIYVILDLMGQSFVVKDQGCQTVDLNQLLADGWRPVRETTFGSGASSILICLEREKEGQIGFGFGH